MTDEKVEAKPCPCCGGRPVVRPARPGPVFCPRCGLTAPRSRTYAPEIPLWNSRSPASGLVPMPSTSMRSKPCPCCGKLRTDPYVIRHEGLALRLCPFCGGKPFISVSCYNTYVTFRIECWKCHAGGRYTSGGYEADPEPILKLAELWNRRTSDPGEDSR